MAIADSISERLSDTYRVAIEERTYFSEASESLMVGIPDVSIVTQKIFPYKDRSLVTAVMPKTVTVPMAEEVQERYLEIRDVSSGAVIT